MTEFDEEEIFKIEEDFRKLAHKQYQDSRRLFFWLLLIFLGLLFVGALIGLILSQ